VQDSSEPVKEIYLRLWKIAVKRVTVVKFGVDNIHSDDITNNLL